MLFAGRDCSLQVTSPQGHEVCYILLVYDLVQPPSLPIVIKDRAWLVTQLEAVVKAEASKRSGAYRSFYLFDRK